MAVRSDRCNLVQQKKGVEMKLLAYAGLVLIGVAVGGAPVAQAAGSAVATATTDMTAMLGAIAHPDYNKFVAPTTREFKAHVTAIKFPSTAAHIDQQIPLAQPFTVELVTTQKVGAILAYIFEVTLHNGNQVLVGLTLKHGKVSSFHLL